MFASGGMILAAWIIGLLGCPALPACAGEPPKAKRCASEKHNPVPGTYGTFRFAAPTYYVAENAGTVTVAVLRVDNIEGYDVGVQLRTFEDGSARSGYDFVEKVEVLEWLAGDFSSRTSGIRIINTDSVEGTRWFSLKLMNGATGGIVDDTCRVYITDDDVPGALNFSPDSVSVYENAGQVTLSVTRTGGSAGPASAHYYTIGGTATPANDYDSDVGDLHWEDGDASPKTITVRIIDDNAYEPDKTLYVILNGASNATLGASSKATITILNDDQKEEPGTIQFQKAISEVSEQIGTLDVMVTRANGSKGAATVHYATYAQTAEDGIDFRGVSGDLEWVDGFSDTKTIEIPIIESAEYKNKRSFVVRLSNPSGAALGSPSAATAFIQDKTAVGFDTNRVQELFGTADPVRLVQVIDTDNQQLVAGAATVVRVYLKSNVPDRDIPVWVELWCDANDVGAKDGIAWRKGRFDVTAPRGPTHEIVKNGDDSVNIFLGRGSTATAAGRHRFVARVFDYNTRELYVKQELYVTFKNTASIAMVVVPINVLMTPINGSNTIAYADPRHLANANEYLQYAYPVGANAVDLIATPALQWDAGMVRDHNDRLLISTIRLRALLFPETGKALQNHNYVYFVGAIADVKDIIGTNCMGFTFGADTSVAMAYNKFSIVAAHEIGHDHPFRLGDRYKSNMSEPHDVDGRFITIDIGAFSPVYRHPASSIFAGLPRIYGYGSSNVYGFMGAACENNWAERYEFNGIFPLLTAGNSLNSRAIGKAATLSPTGAMAVVQGAVTTNNLATLSALAPFASSNSIARPESGMYYLAVLDSATQELDRAWFDVSWTLYNGDGMTNVTLAPFAEAVWLPTNTRTVNVCASNGAILASLIRSANAPTVTLSGATQDGQDVNLSWTGSDADGGTLTYSVYYSHDGRATFAPILSGLTNTTTQIGMANQPGGNYCQFRILASDGMNAGWADTGFMIFSNQAPVVTISSLTNGENIADGKTIHLMGAAYDCEDGVLTNSALVWLVNDEPVGMGEYTNFIAAMSGVYTVTLEARDTSGNVGSQSVTVTAGPGTIQTAGTVLAADFDGDGKADPAVVEQGQWYVWFSFFGYGCGGPYALAVNYGTPVAGDFDGDRLADPAMAAGTNWYVWFSSGGYQRQGPFNLGVAGAPLVADIDADGKADPIVVACGGDWYAWPSASGYAITGPVNPLVCGDPIAGDFDGDRQVDIGIVANGNWTLWLSGAGYSAIGPFALGDVESTPAVGDLDGDRRDDLIMVNTSDWRVWCSQSGYQGGGPYHIAP